MRIDWTYPRGKSIMNVSNTDDMGIVIDRLAPLYFATHIVLMTLMLFGNGLTIVAVLRFPALQTVTNIFTVSMSVSDVLCGLVIPYSCLLKYTRFLATSEDRRIACWTVITITVTTHGMSLYSLLAIAVDRFVSVFYSLRYASIMTFRRALVFTIFLWLYIFTSTLINIVVSDTWPVPFCGITYLLPYTIYVIFVAGNIWFALTITVVLYGCIFVVAKRQARRIQNQMASVDTSECSKRERKVTLMMAIVLGTFMACWAPFAVSSVVRKRYVTVPRAVELVYQFTVVLMNMNSVLNPFIYGWKNEAFSEAFRKLLRCPKKIAEIHSTTG